MALSFRLSRPWARNAQAARAPARVTLSGWLSAAFSTRVREYFRYHGIFAPTVRLMRDIDFRYKALLVAAAFAIPTGLVVSVELRDQWHVLADLNMQRAGWRYFHGVDKLAAATGPWREHLAQDHSAQGHASSSDRVDRAIEEAFTQTAALQDDLGEPFGTGHAWQELNAAYVHLNDPDTPAATRSQRLEAFMVSIDNLSHAVTQGARLTLQSNPDAHVAAEIGAQLLPPIAASVRGLQARLGALPPEGPYTLAQLEPALRHANRLLDELAALRAHVDRLQALRDQPRPAIEAQLLRDGERLGHDVRSFVLNAQTPADRVAMLTHLQGVRDELNAVRGGWLDEVDTILQQHQLHMRHRLQWLSGTVLFGIVLAIYVMIAFSRVMRGGMQLIQAEVARMAKGDLSGRVLPRGDDEVADTLRSLRESLARLADLFTVVRRGVASVSHASGDISSASESLAERIQSATDTMDGLQEGVRRTLDNLETNHQCVGQAVSCVREVTADAGRSRRAMTRLSSVIDNLQERSTEISKFVTLIDGIAFQTNLLALNASVEAAKAGEAGKGFGVVASEVRSLAMRVGDAAAQIAAVVGESTNQIDQGRELAQGTSEAVHATEAHVQELDRVLQRLNEVTQKGRSNADAMTTTLHEVSHNSEQTNELVLQMARAAKVLRLQSLKLAEQSSKFKLG